MVIVCIKLAIPIGLVKIRGVHRLLVFGDHGLPYIIPNILLLTNFIDFGNTLIKLECVATRSATSHRLEARLALPFALLKLVEPGADFLDGILRVQHEFMLDYVGSTNEDILLTVSQLPLLHLFLEALILLVLLGEIRGEQFRRQNLLRHANTLKLVKLFNECFVIVFTNIA